MHIRASEGQFKAAVSTDAQPALEGLELELRTGADGVPVPGGTAAIELEHMRRAQPALAELFREQTKSFPSATQVLAEGMLHLAWKTFARTSPWMAPIAAETVNEAFARLTTVLYNLGSADDAFVEHALSSQSSPDPELMNRLEHVLLEHCHEGHPLDHRELGVLFALARTAVVMLHTEAHP